MSEEQKEETQRETYKDSDTVRILPDGAFHRDAGQHDTANVEEQPPLRHGTLYTPAPEATQPRPQRRFEPYGATNDHQVARSKPPVEPFTYSHQPLARDTAGERRQDTHEPTTTATTATTAKRGPSACVILAGTFSLLAVACAVLAFATFRDGLGGLGKLTGFIPSFGFVTTPTVTIDTSRPAVIDRVRALGKLETVHYELEKVVSGKSSGMLPDFFTSDKILLVAHGEVVGGIDLEAVTPSNITGTGTIVQITLPPAQILYSKLDNDKTYVYDRQTGIFNKPDPNLETQLRKVAEQEIVKAAQEDDILGKARVNAEGVLRSLLSGLGYTDVQFKEEP
ncbi:MAG: DUF4230 domain-containing protein [Chloroflexota bacterium]|nr:DUF4230 domain-containing protein [Chloroflexota bacterium]